MAQNLCYQYLYNRITQIHSSDAPPPTPPPHVLPCPLRPFPSALLPTRIMPCLHSCSPLTTAQFKLASYVDLLTSTGLVLPFYYIALQSVSNDVAVSRQRCQIYYTAYSHESFHPHLVTASSPLHRYEWVEHGDVKGLALWGHISQWDTSSVKDMQRSFSTSRNSDGSSCGSCSTCCMTKAEFFDADISAWITSAVTTMRHMFFNAQTFTSSLKEWDVRQVTSMYRTFDSAGQWNGDISKWNVAEVHRVTEQLCVCRTELVVSADRWPRRSSLASFSAPPSPRLFLRPWRPPQRLSQRPHCDIFLSPLSYRITYTLRVHLLRHATVSRSLVILSGHGFSCNVL